VKIFHLNDDVSSVFHHVFGLRGELRLGVVVPARFSLVEADPQGVGRRSREERAADQPVAEPAAPPFLPDAIPFKPVAEFTVKGTCWLAEPDVQGVVTMAVGPLSKSLRVLGPRQWQKRLGGWHPGPPEPFTSLPLSYEHALGGPFDPDNPEGHGRDPVTGVVTSLPVPRLERPDEPIRSPSQRLGLVGCGPIPAGWQSRRRWIGTLTDAWARDRWPWIPDDFDSRFFLTAPEDQQAAGFFRGDESIRLAGMHPEGHLITADLPRRRARCFIARNASRTWNAPVGEFEEVPLVLDTIAIDADKGYYDLVWRGQTPIAHIAGRDVHSLLIFLERLNEPEQPPAWYRDLFDQVLAAEVGRAEQPELEAAEFEAEMAEFEQTLKARLKAELVIPPEVLAGMEETAALARENSRYFAEAGRPQYDAVGMIESQLDELRQAIAGFDSRVEQGLAAPQLTKAKMAEILGNSADEPLIDLPAIRENAAFLRDKLGDPHLAPDTREQLLDSLARWDSTETELSTLLDRVSAIQPDVEAQLQASLPAWMLREPPPIDEPLDVEAARREGLAHLNLAGYDFHGLDLSGVDFREASLDRVNFSGCTLRGCDFTAATVGRADFGSADLSEAILAGVDFSQSNLAGSCFSGAELSGASFSGRSLVGADFSNTRGEGTDFFRADLTRARFRAAELATPTFTEATLDGGDFTEASLTKAEMDGVHCHDGQFARAKLVSWRGGRGSEFVHCNFRQAAAATSIWSDSCLDGSDFSGAVLDRGYFAGSLARGTSFHRAHLAEAHFEDAALPDANFTQARLLRANLTRADLTRARLTAANLAAAALIDCILRDADLSRAITVAASFSPGREEAR
jgi:uncharacterized protein YjbI with pentapeptide repeats